jgi:hypothetical protein
MMQMSNAPKRSVGQRYVIPLIVLIGGLLFLWNSPSSNPESGPHVFVLNLMNQARDGGDSDDPSLGFMEREAISAIVDLPEPWTSSESLQNNGHFAIIVSGENGQQVTVIIDAEPYRVIQVIRSEK